MQEVGGAQRHMRAVEFCCGLPAASRPDGSRRDVSRQTDDIQRRDRVESDHLDLLRSDCSVRALAFILAVARTGGLMFVMLMFAARFGMYRSATVRDALATSMSVMPATPQCRMHEKHCRHGKRENTLHRDPKNCLYDRPNGGTGQDELCTREMSKCRIRGQRMPVLHAQIVISPHYAAFNDRAWRADAIQLVTMSRSG